MPEVVDHKAELLRRLRYESVRNISDYVRKHKLFNMALDDDGNTLFHIAAQIGNMVLFNALIQPSQTLNTIPPNTHGQTPWHIAAIYGQLGFFEQSTHYNEMQQRWLIQGDNDGNTPLHYAAQYSDKDKFQLQREKIKIVKQLCSQDTANAQNKQGRTPLMMAVACGAQRAATELTPFSNIDLCDSQGDSALDLLLDRGSLDSSSITALSTPANLIRRSSKVEKLPLFRLAGNFEYDEEEFLTCMERSHKAKLHSSLIELAIALRAKMAKSHYQKRYLKDSILSVLCPAATIAVAFEFLPVAAFAVVPIVFTVAVAVLAWSRYKASMLAYEKLYEEHLHLRYKLIQAKEKLKSVETQYRSLLDALQDSPQDPQLIARRSALANELQSALKYHAQCMEEKEFNELKLQNNVSRTTQAQFAMKKGRRLSQANLGSGALCSGGAAVAISTSMITSASVISPAIATALSAGITIGALTFPPSAFIFAGIAATVLLTIGIALLMKNTLYKTEKSEVGKGNHKIMASLSELQTLKSKPVAIELKEFRTEAPAPSF